MADPSSIHKTKMSSSGSSKIPFRAPTPGSGSKVPPVSKVPKLTPRPGAKRLVVPLVYTHGRKSPTSPLALPPVISSPTKSTSPTSPSNFDKPLPSPPVAQIIDPMSPPKARRSLVDATVIGTPTEEDWPILKPEVADSNLKPTTAAMADIDAKWYFGGSTTRTSSLPQPALSLGSNNPYTNVVEVKAHPTRYTAVNAASQSVKSYPGALRRFENPSSPPFLPKEHDQPIDSPLARKRGQRQGVIAPPASFNRKKQSSIMGSGETSSKDVGEGLVAREKLIKPVSTNWPLVDSKPHDIDTNMVGAIGVQQAHDASKSAQTYHAPVSQQRRDTSASLSTVGGSVDAKEDSECHMETETRIKRLSKNYPASGLGPVLTINKEADAVLLGTASYSLESHVLPDEASEKTTPDRSLNALAGRISRQTARLSFAKCHRQSMEAEVDSGASCVAPISSMQSPGKGGDHDRKNSSMSTVPSEVSVILNEAFATVSASKPPSGVMKKSEITSESYTTLKDTRENGHLPMEYVHQKRFHDEDPSTKRSSIPPPPPPKDLPPNSTLPSPRLIIRPTAPFMKRSPTSIFSEMEGSSEGTPGVARDSGRDTSVSAAFQSPFASRIASGSRFRPKLPCPSKSRPSPNVTPFRDASASAYQDLSPVPGSAQRSLDRSNTTVSARPSEDSKSTKNSGAKVRMKKSFRNIFQKKEAGKRSMPTPIKAENKRSSVSMASNSIAKHFRNSANMSNTSLPAAPKRELQLDKESTMQPTPAQHTQKKTIELSPAPALSNPLPDASLATREANITVIHNILDRINAMPADSRDRLRALEIAQTVVHCVEMCQQAKIASQKAEQFAKEAELSANMAQINISKLQKLVEPDFDKDALGAIKQLVRSTGAGLAEE